MRPFVPPTPEELALLHADAERRLSDEEFRAWVDAPMSEQEREDALALIDWFRRRYPTPLERLRAARHLHAQWLRNRPTP